MIFQIQTEVELFVKKSYDCLVINYSVGGRHYKPVCFVKTLRYDGNDEKGQPIFSEEYFTVTKGSFFGLSSGGQFRRYNDDNFIVVAILPERVIGETEILQRHWKEVLKVTPIVANLDED